MTGRRTSKHAYRAHHDGGLFQTCASRYRTLRSAPPGAHSWLPRLTGTACRYTRHARQARIVAFSKSFPIQV